MARMAWQMGSFDLKSLRILSGKRPRGILSKKWTSWKAKQIEEPSLVSSPSPTPAIKDIGQISVEPVSQPPAITISDQPTADGPDAAEAVPALSIEVEVIDKELKEFTCFPDLPAELRSKIWKHASFIPRNVNIWSSDFGKKISIPLNDNEDMEEGDVLVVWKLCSTTPPPVVLSVCTESRTEALKHYRLDFGTSYTFRDFTFTTHPRIYFNFAVDRLCMMESFEGETSRACKNFFNRLLTNGTRYLALNVKRFQDEPRREALYIRPFLEKCIDKDIKTRLENIILVSPEYNREMRGTIEFKDCVEISGDPENVNTVILKGLDQWLMNRNQLLALHERNRYVPREEDIGVDFDFKTLVIDGKACVE